MQLDGLLGAPLAQAPQKLDLDERERVDRRIATVDRGLQHGPGVEQPLAAADRHELGDRELELSAKHRPDPVASRVVGERDVAVGDPEVRLRAPHLGVGEHTREERPLACHLTQHVEPMALAGAAQSSPQAEPGGQDDPRLRPGEHPRDRAKVTDPGGR